jgi:RNase adaptor protein for sRNA GlmZ degradation
MLSVVITSFSYKKGYPLPQSAHGGGFVFDCRCIPNPGREEKFKDKTGKDADVRKYLEAIPEAEEFYKHVKALVLQAIRRYQERGFAELLVSFGCTGGQHRSVYFSERLTKDLKELPSLKAKIKHRELDSL